MPSTLIDIPPDDVFRNDKLGLKPAIQVQSEALLSSSPQAIAIDAGWGSGKTTFIRLWAAYLRKEGVKVVEFNAWKFSLSDPLDALTREILRQFDDIPDEQQGPSHRGLIDLIRRSVPLIRQGVKLGGILAPEYTDAAETLEPVAEVLETVAESIGTDQSSTGDAEAATLKIDSPDAFTSALSEAAKDWSEQHPVVIMVDELDRCSPEYAVEMLQLLEHIFYADNVVFVVSMNRAELAHSVKGFYGESFDADGYLERFFDDVFGLPASNRYEYIRSCLAQVPGTNHGAIYWPAPPYFYESDLSLREIDRAVIQFGEVLQRGPSDSATRSLIYLWIARTLAPVEYRQCLLREVSDRDLAEAVFKKGKLAEYRTYRGRGHNSLAYELEATLISLSWELRYLATEPANTAAATSSPSELHDFHKANVTNDDESKGDIPASYSKRVLEFFETPPPPLSNGIDRSNLQESIRLLERYASLESDQVT